MMFKIGLVVALGAATYATRVGTLADGTAFERAGAWVMAADPSTLWVATQIKLFLS
jgi:hypothetical protein